MSLGREGNELLAIDRELPTVIPSHPYNIVIICHFSFPYTYQRLFFGVVIPLWQLAIAVELQSS